MQAPKTPLDEASRLIALYRLGLLDSAPTESFDRLTRLTSKALEVPIALVSLIDINRQWFKSCVGLDIPQTSREISFCGHVVFERQVLVVPNAELDPRFADNPLVTGAPFIRAYMGAPIYSVDAQPIGTLCVMDVRPREFTATEVETLAEFAASIQEQMHSNAHVARTAVILERTEERRELLLSAFEYAPVGMVHVTAGGELMRANRRLREMLGYTEEELRALSFVHITHPEDLLSSAHLFRQMAAGEIDSYRSDKRFLKKDGEYLWVCQSVSRSNEGSGRPEYIIASFEDISAHKAALADLIQERDALLVADSARAAQVRGQIGTLQGQIRHAFDAERQAQNAKDRLRLITNSLPANIGYWNRELRCEFANEAYRNRFGLPTEQIIGMNMRDLLGEELFESVESHVQLVFQGFEQRFERTHYKSDGSLVFEDVQYFPERNREGEVVGFFTLVLDVTALRTAQAQLEAVNKRLQHESTTDYLSGLANRRALRERSDKAIGRFHDSGQPYGLILLDLDDFKKVNDTYGHEVGDQFITAVGRVLRRQMRDPHDMAARLGGEEFAVVCSGVMTEEQLRALAERLRQQLTMETVPSPQGPLCVTGSFGIALSQAGDAHWKDVYARADAALYQAKASGKNRVIFGKAAARVYRTSAS